MKMRQSTLQLPASLMPATSSIFSALAQDTIVTRKWTSLGSMLTKSRLIFKKSILIGLILISAGTSCVLAQSEQPDVKISAVDEGIFRLNIGNAETHSTFLADANTTKSSVGEVMSNGDWSGVQTADGELLFNSKSGELTLKNSAGKILI